MTTDNSTGGDSDAREAAIELLKSGEATPSDVAHLAGVDRQLVAYWAKVAKINPKATYEARLVRVWRSKLAAVKGSAKPKRPSKAEMREQSAKAVAEFNRKQGVTKRR